MSVWCLALPHFWRRQEALGCDVLTESVGHWWLSWTPHGTPQAKYAISWGSLDLVRAIEVSSKLRAVHTGSHIEIIDVQVEQLEPHRPEHWGEQLINPVTSQANGSNGSRDSMEPHMFFSARWNHTILRPSGESSTPAAFDCLAHLHLQDVQEHTVLNKK